MPDLGDTLVLAKRGRYTRAELYTGMQALAEGLREPGMSEAQAFARLIATPEGSELYQIQKSLPGRDIEPGWQAPVLKAQPTTGDVHTPSSDWGGLVSGLMRSQKVSHVKAINMALSSEEGRALFRQQKRSEQIATGQFSEADMKLLDGIDKEQQEHADIHKRANQHKSEFEHMVEDVRRAKPHLSETQAQDHVRSMPKGMEAWLKHKGKPGANGVPVPPGDTATTGRAGTQWQSGHSGSAPVTPARTPERPSDEPAIKAWRHLKKKMMIDTGWPEERVVSILKLLPEGRRAIERVIEAAKVAVAGS